MSEGCGCQSRASATAEMIAICSSLDEQQRADLAEQQARARQRGGPEPLDHAVAPLEPGRDRQRGERRGHHRQREHPGGELVDRAVREAEVEVLGRGDAADEHDHGDHHGEQQLLAVAQHQPRLHRGLREDLPGQGSGAGVGREGAQAIELPPGDLQEGVLEGPLAQVERLRQHALLLAPGRDRRQRGAVRRAGDQQADLADRGHLEAMAQRGGQRLGSAVGERLGDDQPDRGGAATGELERSAGRDHPAAVDDVDVVGEALGLVHVVRGEYDGHAVGAQLLEQLPRRTTAGRVHPRGRLVHERPAPGGRRSPSPA